jgi:hypothetical protein
MGVVCCYVALGVTRATSQQCRVRAPINVLCLTEYLVDAMLVMSTVCCPHTESYLAPHLIYSLHTRTCSNLLCDSVCESLAFALSNAPLCVRTHTPLRSVAQLYACARTPHSALSLNRREAGLSWSTVSLRCSDQRGSPGGVLYAQR